MHVDTCIWIGDCTRCDYDFYFEAYPELCPFYYTKILVLHKCFRIEHLFFLGGGSNNDEQVKKSVKDSYPQKSFKIMLMKLVNMV